MSCVQQAEPVARAQGRVWLPVGSVQEAATALAEGRGGGARIGQSQWRVGTARSVPASCWWACQRADSHSRWAELVACAEGGPRFGQMPCVGP